ncbi:MAG: hypothetical protein ACR2IP_13580 [Solirubrobacteraceae bacterium]
MWALVFTIMVPSHIFRWRDRHPPGEHDLQPGDPRLIVCAVKRTAAAGGAGW